MANRFERVVLDIETNGLINMLVDYTSRPIVLKPHARIWCISLRDFDNQSDVVSLRKEECNTENLKKLLKDTKELIFHNGIGYDMIMLFMFGILDYRVGYDLEESDTIFGDQPIKFVDTLLLSKLLRQDRLGGHSVEAWGRILGVPKIDFHEFEEYSEEMVTYCEGDTLTQASIYQALLDEMGDDGWEAIDKAYRMEVKLMDLTVRQEMRGFYFDTDLAEKAVVDFQQTLDTIADKVNPILPARPLNKGEQKDYLPPKTQFKKDGSLSAHMNNFIARVGAIYNEEANTLSFEGKDYDLPLQEGIKTSLPGSIDNLDHLKAYLLDLGWTPMEWKERDLTKDSKKIKLQGEKLDATIMRYVDNTLNGPFKKYRLELLGIKDENKLAGFLFDQKDKFSLMVPVSPMIRIGTEKKLCPNLTKLGEQAEFALDVTEYLTYKHRKNSIAGGKEDEEGSPLTGYLSQVRPDHRISTPADTLGANGGRYKHRGVCNVPRVSSLGGQVLRSLFGCGPGRMQLGFDFASLEARIQGHFVIPFTDGEALAASLIAEKPNDCFDTDTEILTASGWTKYTDVTGDTLIANWHPVSKIIDYSKPSDIILKDYIGKMIVVRGDRLDMKLTPNHRVVLFNRDTQEYVTILAKHLKDYVVENNNCFIPANGEERAFDAKGERICRDWDYLNKLDSIDIVNPTENGSIVIQSYNKETVESIALGQVLRGSSARVFTKVKSGKDIYQTTIGKTPLNVDGFKLILDEISEEDYEGQVWCVSVPSTYVLARRNGKMFVSGNCHTINANKLGITRDNAKSFSYACMYGAQPEKLAKMLRIPLKEAERLYEAYWDAVPALKELKERVEAFWKKTGKQYILGIDGRKLYVRSQHSLINLLFQSAGAICVKYTLVGINRRLEELGMLGHPLVDTEEDMASKVYQMIAYHDEAQFDCPPDFFKVHRFATEEEAKEAKNKYSDSSAIGHDDNGFYFCESNILSRFIEEEIFRVCMDLDLRVPLGMEYIVGTTWAECH